MKIYHNPRCAKSRQTLALLKENGQNPEIIEYLKTPLSEKELEDILIKLNMDAVDLVRKSEPVYKVNFKGKTFNKHEWIRVLVENPKLIERPIVVSGYKAVLGRPPENALDLIQD